MTTAHKPTWHPAVGGASQGGWRYHAPRMQYSNRDMAAETKLKTRQIGQSNPDEVDARDLKKELLDREAKHFKKVHDDKVRQGLIKDTPLESNKMLKNIDFSKFDDDDDTDSDDSDDESDNEDDEELELQRELERIKKEREDEKRRKEAEEQEEQLEMQNEEILQGNPLLNASTFTVKRRWDEDCVFKNQSRSEKKVVKRFINDTIRSDFHRSFIRKYMK